MSMVRRSGLSRTVGSPSPVTPGTPGESELEVWTLRQVRGALAPPPLPVSSSLSPTLSLHASHLPSLVSFSLPLSSVRSLPSPDTNALSAGPSCGPWLSLEDERGAQLCSHEQGLLGIHLYIQQSNLLGVPSSLGSEQKAGWGKSGEIWSLTPRNPRDQPFTGQCDGPVALLQEL